MRTFLSIIILDPFGLAIYKNLTKLFLAFPVFDQIEFDMCAIFPNWSLSLLLLNLRMAD